MPPPPPAPDERPRWGAAAAVISAAALVGGLAWAVTVIRRRRRSSEAASTVRCAARSGDRGGRTDRRALRGRAAAAAVDTRVAAGVAIALGIMLCVVTFGGLPLWRWLLLGRPVAAPTTAQVQLAELDDVEIDGTPMGVLVDKHTVVTMVSVWGKPYMPTLLQPGSRRYPEHVAHHV